MSLGGRGYQSPTSLCPSEPNAGIESSLISKRQIKSLSQTLRKPVVIASVKNQSEGPEPIHSPLARERVPEPQRHDAFNLHNAEITDERPP